MTSCPYRGTLNKNMQVPSVGICYWPTLLRGVYDARVWFKFVDLGFPVRAYGFRMKASRASDASCSGHKPRGSQVSLQLCLYLLVVSYSKILRTHQHPKSETLLALSSNRKKTKSWLQHPGIPKP